MITQSAVFRSVANAVLPAIEQLDEAGWQRVGAVVERALSERPAAMRRQLQLFLHVLNLRCLLRHGRLLAALPVAQRARFLERIERSRLLLLRRGFWGLRTLIFMGYYTQPEARAAIGYRASALGWQAVR